MTALLAKGLALPSRFQITELKLEGAQSVALVGPNGGGKTSLLRALAGVEGAVGDVFIHGELTRGVSEARRRNLISFLPASRDLAWPITARDAIALGLAENSAERVTAMLDLFELTGLAERAINSLSTGERGRVLLARALVARPMVVLLDEPLAHLEPYWVLRVSDILRDLANEGALVVTAIHELHLINSFDRILLVADGVIQLNERPVDLISSDRFEEIFRITQASDGWKIKPAGRQSSP